MKVKVIIDAGADWPEDPGYGADLEIAIEEAIQTLFIRRDIDVDVEVKHA